MNQEKARQYLIQRGFKPHGDNGEYWDSNEYPEIDILNQDVALRVFDMDGYTIKFIYSVKELKKFLDEKK